MLKYRDFADGDEEISATKLVSAPFFIGGTETQICAWLHPTVGGEFIVSVGIFFETLFKNDSDIPGYYRILDIAFGHEPDGSPIFNTLPMGLAQAKWAARRWVKFVHRIMTEELEAQGNNHQLAKEIDKAMESGDTDYAYGTRMYYPAIWWKETEEVA